MFVKGSGTTVVGQGLQLNFQKSSVRSVVKADLVVHGVSNEGRVMPAAAGAPSGALTQTFHLTNDGEPILHSAIWTRSMSAVSWVDIVRIEFANGVVWQASPESRCRAVPNGFVLVANPR
jgi:hypothetical protein